jgi:hypothetical protein
MRRRRKRIVDGRHEMVVHGRRRHGERSRRQLLRREARPHCAWWGTKLSPRHRLHAVELVASASAVATTTTTTTNAATTTTTTTTTTTHHPPIAKADTIG